MRMESSSSLDHGACNLDHHRCVMFPAEDPCISLSYTHPPVAGRKRLRESCKQERQRSSRLCTVESKIMVELRLTG